MSIESEVPTIIASRLIIIIIIIIIKIRGRLS